MYLMREFLTEYPFSIELTQNDECIQISSLNGLISEI